MRDGLERLDVLHRFHVLLIGPRRSGLCVTSRLDWLDVVRRRRVMRSDVMRRIVVMPSRADRVVMRRDMVVSRVLMLGLVRVNVLNVVRVMVVVMDPASVRVAVRMSDVMLVMIRGGRGCRVPSGRRPVNPCHPLTRRRRTRTRPGEAAAPRPRSTVPRLRCRWLGGPGSSRLPALYPTP